LLAELSGAEPTGADILGFFLEGHFLALTGAIRNMKPVHSLARVEALKKALGNRKGIFGISPEIPGICSLLPLICEGGVPAFITHTKASYDETEKAIAAGARHGTHFYDVFPYPGEQEPGVRGCGAVEAIMAQPEVSVDFILDGEHVHPGVVKMALACKGLDKVCLMTDANLNAGMAPGVYQGIGGTEIVMKYPGGPAREYFPSPGCLEEGQTLGGLSSTGGLTGSGLTMDLALKNAVKLLGLSLPDAAALCSANPARVLGLEHERGRIEKGFLADFSLLDKDLNVTACYIGGELAASNE
jgi:N-acetylglucosamine-6-phosphate deacetylase